MHKGWNRSKWKQALWLCFGVFVLLTSMMAIKAVSLRLPSAAESAASAVADSQAQSQGQSRSTSQPEAANPIIGAISLSSSMIMIPAVEEALPESVRLEAPLIYQMPELERGCEVTSLAMLLQHAGIQVDKMTLADQIIKDPTPFEIYDHSVHFGNPNDGFVGDMETFEKPGLGVYHEPIKKLAEQYLPGRVVDATGAEFEEILQFLQKGSPVWVITNMDYEKLDDDAFETWETPAGPMDITYLEHSVLITGYDNEMVYFNDPLGDSEQANKQDFIEAWEQMGRQAISYVP